MTSLSGNNKISSWSKVLNVHYSNVEMYFWICSFLTFVHLRSFFKCIPFAAAIKQVELTTRRRRRRKVPEMVRYQLLIRMKSSSLCCNKNCTVHMFCRKRILRKIRDSVMSRWRHIFRRNSRPTTSCSAHKKWLFVRGLSAILGKFS